MSEQLKTPASYLDAADITTDKLTHQPEGVILLSYLPKTVQSPPNVELHPRPDYAEGRKRSIHGVYFADLALAHTDRPVVTQPVAIKPVLSVHFAAHEYRTADYLNRDGQQLTFQLLGFIRRGSQFSTITKFDSGVVSYDNIILQERSRPPEQAVQEALIVAARTLLILHDKQLVHGDFQIKNTASDINGRTRVVDLTTMRAFSTASDVSDDITQYTGSLTRFGTRPSPITQQQFQDYFLDTYRDGITDVFPVQRQADVRIALAGLRAML